MTMNQTTNERNGSATGIVEPKSDEEAFKSQALEHWLRSGKNGTQIEAIRAVHGEHRGVYGSPRMMRMLRLCGLHHSRKRIARLMKAAGLRGKCPHRLCRKMRCSA